MSFELNRRQTDPGVKFSSRGSGYRLFLTDAGAVLSLSKSRGAAGKGRRGVLSIKPVRANPGARLSGLEELPGKSNYFVGKDPRRWQTDVPNYGRVKYESLYPGVDMVYYGNQSRLEYDFVVAPGADASRIKLSFEGASRIRLDKSGDLLLTVAGEEIRQLKPVIYQEVDGRRREVAGSYRLTGTQVGFQIGDYDRNHTLVIDPVLIYSTYLGGYHEERGYAITLDSAGNVYVAGESISSDFPIVNPYRGTINGNSPDAFVTKLDPTGTQVLYSTFIGGTWGERPYGVAVDPSGYAYVTGSTNSTTDFPLLNAFMSRGQSFIFKLGPAGNSLVYSSYLDIYEASDIAIDAAGNAYVVGYSGPSVQTVNALQPAFGGGYADVTVSKVNAAGSALVYHTYFGGDGDDRGTGLVLDSSGNVYLTGFTSSTNLPTLNAFQSTFGGVGTCGFSPNTHPCYDAFAAKLNNAGDTLIYSTYLGGSSDDQGNDIAVDAAGNAYVAGMSRGVNFPLTAGSLQTTFGGEDAASGFFGDAFVTKLNPSGSGLVYSTLHGGSSEDVAYGIDIDATGAAYLVGMTRSPNFPTAQRLQATGTGVFSDAYVAKLNPAGNALAYSTYLGGNQYDTGERVVVDASNNAYVIGWTRSPDFPTAAAYQPTFRSTVSGTFDVFVAKISSSDGFTISGRIVDGGGNGVGGVTMTLNGTRTLTAQTDTNGNYAFSQLKAGENCTLTPTKNLYIFNPVSQSVANLSNNETVNFTATTSATTYTIGGRVTDAGGNGAAGINVTLGGSLSKTTLTDAAGNYSFTQLVQSGNYTVTPTKSAYNLTYTFTPPSRSYTNLAANQVADFSFITSTAVTLLATADAYVQDGAATANTNYGNVTPLSLRTDRRTDNGLNRDVYLKFNLSSVTRSITSAKLRIYAALSEAGTVSTAAYSVSNVNWVESGAGGITWNNKPARSATNLTGAT
ncbi:MAG TPA: SBBP repeat-containing protein, partial [Pyrinomonadaceae bacterium]